MALTQLILAAKAALTDPILADGAISSLTLNKDGRLRVSTKPGRFTVTSTNMSVSGDQAAVDVSDAASLTFSIKNTGTATATTGNFILEGSPDSTNGVDGTWFGVMAVRSNSNTIDSAIGTGLTAGGTFGYSHRVNVAGYSWFRIRCTTSLTAGAIYTAVYHPSADSAEPIPYIPTHAVTQSGTWAVTEAAGSAYASALAAGAILGTIKASSGNLIELSLFNPTAAIVYFKLYNLAANPVLATNTPIAIIPVAAGAFSEIAFSSIGKRFSTGIAFACTGAAAITDATAIAAGVLVSATYV